MKGTLTRIQSTHKNMRTDSMEGEYEAEPELGKSFVILGKALGGSGTRLIATTEVLSLERVGRTTVLKTKNSTYCLEGQS